MSGMNLIDQNTIRDIFAGALGNLLSGVLLAMLGYTLIDKTKLRPWIYKYLKPPVLKIIRQINDILFNPTVRIGIFIFALLMINIGVKQLIFSIIAVFVLLTFVFKQRGRLSSPSSDFSDGFHKLEDIKSNWITKNGTPELDESKGLPSPSLRLAFLDPPQATNTFLLLKDMKSERGMIECDILLEPGSLLNIVFLCDKENDNWHMGRFDTRGGTSDGFLIKDGGKGVNWRINNMAGMRTNPGSWYKVRVEFNSERARMYRNGELLSEITNPQIFGTFIGIFNECGEVRVDNFTFFNKIIQSDF